MTSHAWITKSRKWPLTAALACHEGVMHALRQPPCSCSRVCHCPYHCKGSQQSRPRHGQWWGPASTASLLGPLPFSARPSASSSSGTSSSKGGGVALLITCTHSWLGTSLRRRELARVAVMMILLACEACLNKCSFSLPALEEFTPAGTHPASPSTGQAHNSAQYCQRWALSPDQARPAHLAEQPLMRGGHAISLSSRQPCKCPASG